MAADVHIFGIRHHGPGSARRLREALEALRPVAVLIEGPADATPLAAMLADQNMVPPVTLLAYEANEPSHTIFWPFAVYSPEYQAVTWATANDVPVSFIDVPASWRLAALQAAQTAVADKAVPTDDEELAEAPDDAGEAAVRDTAADLVWDPVGELARAAGYEDGESWWCDVIEENPDPGPVFAAISDAMSELRTTLAHKEMPRPKQPACETDEVREAYMRLEIAKARKANDGDIAVVCGAWHVPALKAKHTAKDDRALIKGFPKAKVTATWAPWTAPRLATASGYGAGVTAPGWCDHLWHTPRGNVVTSWLARIAAALRDNGAVVSTASIIEAERLSTSLAALRGRPAPGFEEMREAAIACLCFGEDLLWHQIETLVLIGNDVGAIPDDVPLTPLLQDLQRQQRAVRLKPEALEKELSIDLRSDSGLARSTLLHRLNALDVPWGRVADAGRSRGTFRERWVIAWEPEYAVKLVEHLVYGSTIEQAANGLTIARLAGTGDLGDLADLVLSAMTARLTDATEKGIDALGRRAAQTSDCTELMSALPPLADIIRYGEARSRDAGQLEALAHRIAVQSALALPYAARDLDAEAAKALTAQLSTTDQSVGLINLPPSDVAMWHGALRTVLDDVHGTAIVRGAAGRLLYEADALTADEAAQILSKMLSPGTPVADAAGFFEGFFEGAGQRLIFDDALRVAVDDWVATLGDETFIEYLPLFRRVLSSLDLTERRHLLDRLFGAATGGS
ncbi:MAG: DUF5682 family protein, partial [Pseudomonadota bacterium]